ncbi:hypothetical protein GCM10009549_29700 [Streptomyces thermoalcalitolerans]|uniref:Uncharacterized protein n=1 Tax=Streptomyces thermoalcalitolerans TaxID=65605 RepID=A0ABN1NQQ5_9ACTN
MSSSGYVFDLENDTSFEWLTAGSLAKKRGKAPRKAGIRFSGAGTARRVPPRARGRHAPSGFRGQGVPAACPSLSGPGSVSRRTPWAP